MSSSENG